MKLRTVLTAFSIIYLVSACQSLPGDTVAETAADTRTTSTAPLATAVVAPTRKLTKKDLPPADLWERVRGDLSWQSIHNAQVGKARDGYLRQHDYLPVVAERASLYLYYIVEEVDKRGMPMEIALLPLVESTLNPFAYSSARAAGLWQIMPATGRHLGLEQDWWYDGRRDLRDSTRIALDYLEALRGV